MTTPRLLDSPAGARPDAHARLEAELAEAMALLTRLVEAEDRIGLVYPVMDDARRLLARHRIAPSS